MALAKGLIDRVQNTGFMQRRYMVGDQGMALRLIMNNAKTAESANKEEFEEYIGIIPDDENKTYYDRVYLHYLAAVLQRTGFPMKFIRYIKSLLFDNELLTT